MEGVKSYWETIVDTIQDGVMVVNTEGIIVYVNRAFEEITGYRCEEIEGRACHTLACDACEIVRIADTRNWCTMFTQGHLKNQKCLIVAKNGQTVHAVKNASVIRDHGGRIVGAVETITDVTALTRNERQIETYRQELNAMDRFHGMIGTSGMMQQVFDLIVNSAGSDAPVIILGESGTGKELAARAIHEESRRREQPYVQVNCAALSESLLESELFGHVKGAFTGAHCSRKGRFEAAQGGCIFLDEIGDLPISLQVKLLRVLEEKVVERVGHHHPIPVDVRIISATNHNLEHLLEQGAFRQDFFYRINVIPIRIPPLRERTEDIPLLARSFFNRIRMKSGKPIEGFSTPAMDLLMHHTWPGNVRELRSAIEYAFVVARENHILPEHLPTSISRHRARKPLFAQPGAPFQDIEKLKKERLIDALKTAQGNQSEAARLLGISRTSVWSQTKRFNIDAASYKPGNTPPNPHPNQEVPYEHRMEKRMCESAASCRDRHGPWLHNDRS